MAGRSIEIILGGLAAAGDREDDRGGEEGGLGDGGGAVQPGAVAVVPCAELAAEQGSGGERGHGGEGGRDRESGTSRLS